LKGRYEINADRKLAAFGAANLASAISQGFAVTGADSRTAVADAAGGRTQVTGLVAAASCRCAAVPNRSVAICTNPAPFNVPHNDYENRQPYGRSGESIKNVRLSHRPPDEPY